MAYYVHRRVQGDREVFRIWSTNVDRYVTGEVSWEEVSDFFLEVHRQNALYGLERMKERILKANTSSLVSTRTPGEDWETEMCSRGRFHHAFSISTKDPRVCAVCGEIPEDHAHLPDCGERG